MIAERSFIAVCYLFEGSESHVVDSHLVESNAHQIWMASQQAEEAFHFQLIFKRRFMSPIKLGHLFKAKVSQLQPSADIKRRLILICNKEMRLRGISYSHGQSPPGSRGINRALVVPGTKQTEDLTGVRTGEQAINFIQSPNPRC